MSNAIKNNLEQKLNHVLALNTELISSTILTNFVNTELEKSFKGLFIDLFAIDSCRNTPVFIESQVGKMDSVHFKKINDIIEAINNEDSISHATIVWISSEVSTRFNKQLESAITHLTTKIEIIIIEFDENYLHYLDSLDFSNLFKIYANDFISKLKYPHLQIKQVINQLPENFLGNLPDTKFEPINKNWKAIFDLNESLLNNIRERFPHFNTFIRSKSNLERRSMQFGTSLNDISLVISLANTSTKESTIVIRRGTMTNSMKTYKALQLLLREIPFNAPTGYNEKSFIINYGKKENHQLISLRMMLDIHRILYTINKLNPY